MIIPDNCIGQFAANWAQLVEDNVHFIVPAQNYDVRNDKRLLIPFMKSHKIGFTNQMGEPVVKPIYDIYSGQILSNENYIHVGIRYSYGYACGNGKVPIYERYKWGLINSGGDVFIEPRYASICISDNQNLITLQDYDKGYCVITKTGEILVDYGVYDIIDGFTHGYARVKLGKKWGIINEDGTIALPIDYDEVWFFYNKPELKSTNILQRGKQGQRFYFSTGSISKELPSRRYVDSSPNTSHYSEYAGTYAQDVAGFSDETINDAFDGDPDAYWNID